MRFNKTESMTFYHRTQFGKLVVGAIGAVVIFELYLTAVIGLHPIILGFTAVLVLLLIGFCSLTVRVDREKVVARFGPGPIRRTVQLAEIRAVRAVKNKWWYGWGIRLTPHGWLYNVSGLDAVEMELADNRKVRFGTAEPNELEAAIRRAAGLD